MRTRKHNEVVMFHGIICSIVVIEVYCIQTCKMIAWIDIIATLPRNNKFTEPLHLMSLSLNRLHWRSKQEIVYEKIYGGRVCKEQRDLSFLYNICSRS